MPANILRGSRKAITTITAVKDGARGDGESRRVPKRERRPFVGARDGHIKHAHVNAALA